MQVRCDRSKFVEADRQPEAGAAGRDGKYQLGSWGRMANRVDLIVLPERELSRVITAVKARTAQQVTRLLARIGQPRWAKDYYDHWIRSRTDEQVLLAY